MSAVSTWAPAQLDVATDNRFRVLGKTFDALPAFVGTRGYYLTRKTTALGDAKMNKHNSLAVPVVILCTGAICVTFLIAIGAW
jgi:hypothetical protein